MPGSISLAEAQTNLKQIVDNLGPGEQIVITEDQQPIARIVGARAKSAARPAPGLGKGSILFIAPDFDEPLEEFQEYTG